MPRIIYFISPHGYGHAARAAADIAELARRLAESRCTAFTTVPRWVFDDSPDRAIGMEAVDVDLGMIQHDAFTEDDPPGTAGPHPLSARSTPSPLASTACTAISWSAISPPSQDVCPEPRAIADDLAVTFSSADYQCRPSPSACRRRARAWSRRRVDLGRDDPWLVIPGSPQLARDGRVIRLPAHSDFEHPDLIHAADVVVGKLGYSTLAEVWAAGVPFGCVMRPHFPESAPLEA